LHLAFDAQLGHVQGVFGRLCLVGQPLRGPTDEIGSEDHETLLQVDGWLGTHFDVVQAEDLLAFLDPGFDDLPAIVMLEPGRRVLRDRVCAEVKQRAVLEGLAGVEALQGNVQRIRAAFELHLRAR